MTTSTRGWHTCFQNPNYPPFCTILGRRPAGKLDGVREEYIPVEGVEHDDIFAEQQPPDGSPDEEEGGVVYDYHTMTITPGCVVMCVPRNKGEEPWLLLVERVWLVPSSEVLGPNRDPQQLLEQFPDSWAADQVRKGRLPSSHFQLQGSWLYRWSDLKTLVQKLQEGVPEDGDGEGPAALLQAAAERLGLVAPGKPVLTASVTRELLQLVAFSNARQEPPASVAAAHPLPPPRKGRLKGGAEAAAAAAAMAGAEQEAGGSEENSMVSVESVMTLVKVHWLKRDEGRPLKPIKMDMPNIVKDQEKLETKAEEASRQHNVDAAALGAVVESSRKALAAVGRAAPLPGFCCPLFLLSEEGPLSLHWLGDGDWGDPRSVAQAAALIANSSHRRLPGVVSSQPAAATTQQQDPAGGAAGASKAAAAAAGGGGGGAAKATSEKQQAQQQQQQQQQQQKKKKKGNTHRKRRVEDSQDEEPGSEFEELQRQSPSSPPPAAAAAAAAAAAVNGQAKLSKQPKRASGHPPQPVPAGDGAMRTPGPAAKPAASGKAGGSGTKAAPPSSGKKAAGSGSAAAGAGSSRDPRSSSKSKPG